MVKNYNPEISYSFKKQVCERFLKQLDKTNRKKEMLLCQKVLSSNWNKDFWESFRLDFKLNSMAFFLTKKGLDLLKKEILIFSAKIEKEKESIILSDKKVGEDIVISKKRKTLIDFLEK